jgi:hypothetical protein
VATLDYSTPETETGGDNDAVPHAAIGFAITPLLFGAVFAFASDRLVAAGGCVGLFALFCFPAGIISLAAHVVTTRKKLVGGPERTFRWIMFAVAAALLFSHVALVWMSIALR